MVHVVDDLDYHMVGVSIRFLTTLMLTAHTHDREAFVELRDFMVSRGLGHPRHILRLSPPRAVAFVAECTAFMAVSMSTHAWRQMRYF
jgi:hypothetical protein